jgi:hypothetical protein
MIQKLPNCFDRYKFMKNTNFFFSGSFNQPQQNDTSRGGRGVPVAALLAMSNLVSNKFGGLSNFRGLLRIYELYKAGGFSRFLLCSPFIKVKVDSTWK